MKTKFIFAVLALFVFLVAGASAQPFRSDSEAYQYGYDQGFQHGVADKDVDLQFDYHREYPTGDSYESYENRNFRDGYAQGYTDGYNGRRHSGANPPVDEDRDRDHDRRHDREDRFDASLPRSQDGIAVFTEEKFKGKSREFGLGRYPDLHGDWNDSIESVQIIGPARVIFFDKKDFRGKRLIVEQDEANLGELNFEGKAASMIVEPLR